MLQLCVVLLVIGVLAIILEMLMPGFDGFISGIVGVFALVTSAVIAVMFVPGGWFIVVLNVGILAFTVLAFFAYIRRKQLHGRMLLSDTLLEDTSHVNINDLMGKEGVATSALRPYGEVDFGGVRVEVSSCGGIIIERGAKVRVVEIQANKVIVNIIN